MLELRCNIVTSGKKFKSHFCERIDMKTHEFD